MKLIGLSGLKTSGKDTTCSIIQDILPNVTRVGFADKLKIMAAMAIGIEAEQYPGEMIDHMNECKEFWEFSVRRRSQPGYEVVGYVPDFTGRQYLQWFGGNARKVFGDSFWVDQVLPQPTRGQVTNDTLLKCMYDRADTVCVSDVRYENEAQRIIDLGGEIWCIDRPGLESDGHSSEVSLPERMVDCVIVNDGSITDLRNEVEAVLGVTR